MSDVRLYYEEVFETMKQEEETISDMIKRLIAEHQPIVTAQMIGEKYYDDQPDILLRKPPEDAEGRTDDKKPHNLLVANFHPNQVDQKVGYLLAEPINFKAEDAILDKIGERFDDSFDDLIIDVLTAASNKGIEWMHVYYDADGNLKFKQIPAEQVVPVYDEYGQLTMLIRHYVLNQVSRAEIWTAEHVYYYMLSDGEYVADYFWGEAIKTHYNGDSWGRIPFVPFRNNSKEKGDLWKYKSLIDAFNNRLSDIQNTFDESTDLIFALKGYNGQDLGEFVRNLRHYKAINLYKDGEIDTITVKIPIEETERYLKMLREMIIDFGRGVDFQSDKFGNSPSGVALKILYSGLDIKAKQLERKTRVAIKELLWFVFDDAGIQADPKDVEMTFQYNRLKNDMEDAQIVVMSKGIISDDTLIGNHPFVDDPQGERERLDEQEIAFNKQLPDITIGGEEDEK
ncbi:phage portal protein [Macrococcus bovicus]|uniref:Phage portal protein n=1 Tax=Macrococcus bovicus TaxID=69968 RepID=A0A4R6BXE1_9STAP|nr:phage portal protein [Macrococcus bovicus]TDM12667.1 phage portal protein [Macrococcus bovicus]